MNSLQKKIITRLPFFLLLTMIFSLDAYDFKGNGKGTHFQHQQFQDQPNRGINDGHREYHRRFDQQNYFYREDPIHIIPNAPEYNFYQIENDRFLHQ